MAEDKGIFTISAAVVDTCIVKRVATGLIYILWGYFYSTSARDTAYMDYMDPDVLCAQNGR